MQATEVRDHPVTRSAVWLDVARSRLFGVRIGTSPGPVLVFLHDGLGSVESLRRFPEQLAQVTALPAFAYDRIGYGQSDPADRFSDDFMGEAADHLELVLETAKIDDCILVGHSDGGTVALLHGARYQGRVRGIVTIAAHVRRDRLTLGQVLRHARMVSAGNIPDWMTRFHGEKAHTLLELWTGAWQQVFYDNWDICEEISRIRVPLLSLQGSEDAYGLPAQLDGISGAVPHAETELIQGLGHFPHLEDAGPISDRVRQFIDDYCPVTATQI